ncbi:MAG: ferrous iron transport protein A [Treponema sp.]|jgi:ferrous iron transport protein A|nr:ferrous iron transport protein A [Treponema sp.]
MMPLTMARAGESAFIKKISGKAKTRQFLENLGFVPGSHVTVITEISGNMIVNIKESRIAISREMASKIMV